MQKSTMPPKTIVYLILTVLAFGSGWPMMKYGVTELPILTFRWLTAILSGIGVLTIAILMRLNLCIYANEIRLAFLCSLFNVTGWFYFSGLGLTVLSAGRSTILAYTHPLFAFLIAVILGQDRFSSRRAIGLVCGMGAVASLTVKEFHTLGEVPIGILSMLAAAFCFALGANLQKRNWQTPLIVLAGWQLIFGGLPLLILAVIFEKLPYTNVSVLGIGAIAYTVLIGNMIGFVLWLKLLDLVSAPIATLSLLPVPLVGIVSGAIILGETIGWLECLAVVLITISLGSTLTSHSINKD